MVSLRSGWGSAEARGRLGVQAAGMHDQVYDLTHGLRNHDRTKNEIEEDGALNGSDPTSLGVKVS